MRHAALFLVFGSLASATLGFAGCSSNGGGSGAGTTTTSHTSSSSGSESSSGTMSSSGSMSSSGTASSSGAPSTMLECTIPNPIPSKGACVSFMASSGGEADAGVDDAGNATTTNCNPVTNAGCTGTDVCGVDQSGTQYFCQGVGTPNDIKPCGDCTAPAASCGAGGLCFSFDGNTFSCAQMCCTNADCGAGKCDTTLIQPALPSGVGLCTTM